MNILSIDTTTKSAAVALKKDNEEIVQKCISNEITHSEKLLPLIDELLTEQNINLKNISVYTTINGPGSFTGIRIGLSTLKAFSFVNNTKIFSITANKLIAYKAYNEIINKNKDLSSKPMYISSFIDAKNNRVYYNLCKVYTNPENKIEIEEKINIQNDNISDALNNISNFFKENNIMLNDNIIFAGNIEDTHKEIIYKTFDYNFKEILHIYPSPADTIIAYLNIANVENYIFDSFTLDAIYARKSQAERLKSNEK